MTKTSVKSKPKEKKFIIQIRVTPNNFDANDVTWLKEGGNADTGFGWQSKETGEIHITRCPECLRENYATANFGVCVWCPFRQKTPVPVKK